jgi:hypothetical protein
MTTVARDSLSPNIGDNHRTFGTNFELAQPILDDGAMILLSFPKEFCTYQYRDILDVYKGMPTKNRVEYIMASHIAKIQNSDPQKSSEYH